MLNRKLSYCVLLFILALVVACGGKKEESEESAPAPSASTPAAGGNTYDASKATATVTGKINFEGAKPTPAKLPYTPECIQAHGGQAGTEESLQVNENNTVKNVLVYVKQGAEKWTFPTPTDPVVLDQKGCDYTPHIIVVQANQPLKIVNSDPFLHNIHPQPKNNPEFNMGQPVKGMEATKTFANPEVAIPVKCDVHRWMQAFIPVVSNPLYNVSGDDGTFTIKLPAGTYTIEAWHEKLGSQTQQVTVTDNEKKEVNFSFKAS
jgi:hypothetical protein